MTQNTPPTRPLVIRNITVASGVIALLCLLTGLFLLYSAPNAPDPAALNVKLLSIVVLVVGVAYTFLTFAFYNLQPWSYSVMRAMVRGSLSPVFSLWGWYDAIDSEEVQRAFGVKLKRRR